MCLLGTLPPSTAAPDEREEKVVADISQFFDKAYEQQEFSQLADAPVDALQGLSESDAKC